MFCSVLYNMENTGRQNTEIYPSKSLSLNNVRNGAMGFRIKHTYARVYCEALVYR